MPANFDFLPAGWEWYHPIAFGVLFTVGQEIARRIIARVIK